MARQLLILGLGDTGAPHGPSSSKGSSVRFSVAGRPVMRHQQPACEPLRQGGAGVAMAVCAVCTMRAWTYFISAACSDGLCCIASRNATEGIWCASWAEARPCAFASGLGARGAMLTEAVLTMVFLGHGTAAVCLPLPDARSCPAR